jgi:glutamate dehydrogenase/leucine dehydrogenase
VSVDEVFRLARAMTLKNAAAGLPHGGGKAGIVADPAMPVEDKERTVRWFARAISDLTGYVPGPDMGTDERCMAWIADEIGRRCVGLPRVLGGIPLDQIGATGFGLAVCAEAIATAGWLDLDGARFAIQGFGAVGRHAARYLVDRGALIVSVADSRGAVVNPTGLDIAGLTRWKQSGAPVAGFPDGDPAPRDDIVATDCDVFVPAARPDVLTVDNVDRLKARVVLPGANLPATADAEAALGARGVLVMPDFIANAGGVICAAVEYHGGSEAQALTLIEERIRTNTDEVLRTAAVDGIPARQAAERLARSRIEEAHGYQRTFSAIEPPHPDHRGRDSSGSCW